MNCSTTPIDTSDSLIISWLQQQGTAYKAPLQTITFVSFATFALQLSIFWWGSQVLDTLITQKAFLNNEALRYLGLSFALLLLLMKIKNGMAHRVHRNVCADLQSKLQYHIDDESSLLTKDKTNFFWQRLWLNYIPTVGNHIAHYSPQKHTALLTPIIAIIAFGLIHWVVALVLIFAILTLALFMPLVEKKRWNKPSKKVENKTEEKVFIALFSMPTVSFLLTVIMIFIVVFAGAHLLGKIDLGLSTGLHHGLFLMLATLQAFTELKRFARLSHQKNHALIAAHNLMNLYESPLKVAHNIGT